jgi:hypothetical protein
MGCSPKKRELDAVAGPAGDTDRDCDFLMKTASGVAEGGDLLGREERLRRPSKL